MLSEVNDACDLNSFEVIKYKVVNQVLVIFFTLNLSNLKMTDSILVEFQHFLFQIVQIIVQGEYK